MCKDYISRGSTNDPCKHVWTARIFCKSQHDIDGYKVRLLSFLRNRERTIPPGLRNDVLFSGTPEQVLREIKSGATSRFNLSPVQPAEEQAKFLNIESLEQLQQHAQIEQLPCGVPTGGETICQNYIVVTMNGAAAVSFFKNVGLFDSNGDCIPGLHLKVMDILVVLTSDITTDNDISFQVLQAPTGNRVVSSQRSQLLRSNVLRVKGRMDPGNGRAFRRVVEAPDLDAALPFDLAKKHKGWATNHRHKNLSRNTSGPPFSLEDRRAIGAWESDCEPTDSNDFPPSKHIRHCADSAAEGTKDDDASDSAAEGTKDDDACTYGRLLGSWKRNALDVNVLST